jgi:hypothetical protein
MNTRAIVDRIFNTPGVESVLLKDQFAGPPNGKLSQLVLSHAISIARSADEDIRVVLSQHTITVARDGDDWIAVAVPTGHSIAKSLRRMIRRSFKSNGKPVRTGPSATPPVPRTTGPLNKPVTGGGVASW